MIIGPLPVGELFAERDLLEFADRGAWNGIHENERVGELPLRERFRQESAQFFRRGTSAVPQNDGGQRLSRSGSEAG